MKAMKNTSSSVKFLMIFLISCMPVFLATAQDVQYRDPADPARGYWQIITDATTKSTVIYFFDGQKNKIYEETIPGKYIKLTGRNIAKINRTFDQIAGKTMVLDQVKAAPLTSPAFRKLFKRQRNKKDLPAVESVISNLAPDSRLQMHAYQVNQTFKFYLIFKNPDQERLNINVTNNVGESIYHESSSRVTYKRKFDFQGMEYGKYKLIVNTFDRKQKYTKLIEIKPPSLLKPEKQPKPNLEISSELANR